MSIFNNYLGELGYVALLGTTTYQIDDGFHFFVKESQTKVFIADISEESPTKVAVYELATNKWIRNPFGEEFIDYHADNMVRLIASIKKTKPKNMVNLLFRHYFETISDVAAKAQYYIYRN